MRVGSVAAVVVAACLGATVGGCKRDAPSPGPPPVAAATDGPGTPSGPSGAGSTSAPPVAAGRRGPDAGAAAEAIDRAATLLGGERGVDHVGIAVKDLDAATKTYTEVLGFNRPSAGRLPNGIQNVNYYFADATYLETLVAWDSDKAAWLAAFTARHSGALFGVLAAWSPEATTAFLGRRGVTVGKPFSGTIQTAGESAMPAEEKWKTFFPPEGTLPGDPLYFIAYPRGPREDFLRKLEDVGNRRQLYHDNTALGLRSIWIAVPDLEVAARAFERVGLPRGAGFRDPPLGARGLRVEAGRGEVWLLAPDGKQGPTAAFLRERGGPGILGVTLMAGSVPAAARLLAARTHRDYPTYPGPLGDSIRVPPELTHGVWIELAQYLVPAAKN